MNKNIKAILLLIVFVCCHLFMRSLFPSEWVSTLRELDSGSGVVLSLVSWLFIFGPFVVLTLILFRNEDWLTTLGLRSDNGKWYFKVAVITCIPMCIGYAHLSTSLDLSLANILTGSVYPAFFEEIIFRGVLFGLLFRICKWGFVPAALVSSLIFGFGHLYQTNDVMSGLMMFGFMAIAGSWFAWLYCECGYRIWYPMWMHFIMNAAYGIFGMSGGAMGEADANIFKASAIVLSIVYVTWLIKNGKKREVTKQRLFKNREAEVTFQSNRVTA